MAHYLPSLITPPAFAPAKIRASFPTLTGIETALITLPPSFLAALHGVAPKKRRAKLRYVLFLAVVGVVAALAADASVREFAIGHERHLVATRALRSLKLVRVARAEPATTTPQVVQAEPPRVAQPEPTAVASVPVITVPVITISSADAPKADAPSEALPETKSIAKSAGKSARNVRARTSAR